MAWSGLFVFGGNSGVCILDLVSLLWGLGYILPHGGLLVFPFHFVLEGSLC